MINRFPWCPHNRNLHKLFRVLLSSTQNSSSHLPLGGPASRVLVANDQRPNFQTTSLSQVSNGKTCC